ncbi:MAG TPA: CBS domain-containing protein [Streptosporangiaceae bacterium]|nr:CBS domain-containing protein [Streptosporangiaceae bacterium]
MTVRARVKDVMTTRVIAARADESCADLAAMLREHRVSGFPVVDGDGVVVGVVSESDLLARSPGSVILGRNIADQARHVEGVIAVRDRFTYPAPASHSASPAASDPGL